MDPDEEQFLHNNNESGDESDFRKTGLKPETCRDYEANPGDRDGTFEPSETEISVRGDYRMSQNDQHSGSTSPLKRPAEGASICPPFKRQKGVLNAEYLELLNLDIDDAAHRVCLDEEVEFLDSQVGLTKWSSIEKRQLFEAASRLGKHDLLGIATRIGTKSELEVQQYLHLLQDSVEKRSKARRSYLEPAEYPAAVELSQQCCHAQEEAADAISVRQERREEQREEHRWGPNWNITPSIARRLSRDLENREPGPGAALRSAQLFYLSTWLSLSERAFMNSSIPGNNWNYIDDRQPSMWATAFDDFYSLAVSVTRRLVQSTLFISLSRIRAKKELVPTTRDIVRKKDVEAAIASLNMLHNSHEIWRTSARRLRLDVFDEPPDRDDEEAEEEPMTYDEVEEKLSFEPETSDEQGSSQEGLEFARPLDDDSTDYAEDSEEVWYSSADIRDVQSARRVLKLRITTEKWQETQAERHDDYASYQAEAEMWSILQRKPPMELPKVQDPGRVQRSNLELDNIYPLERNWASRLNYYEEWETLDTHEEEDF
ncbi:hypothetical protein EsDP_00001145 [Epichloe bromicola]|uniref:Uncharacterized protein n=1 Tax=Epichloe bromicola TaxID=79588 RepID=A0ABQ0CH03_9HYPO